MTGIQIPYGYVTGDGHMPGDYFFENMAKYNPTGLAWLREYEELIAEELELLEDNY